MPRVEVVSTARGPWAITRAWTVREGRLPARAHATVIP